MCRFALLHALAVQLRAVPSTEVICVGVAVGLEVVTRVGLWFATI